MIGRNFNDLPVTFEIDDGVSLSCEAEESGEPHLPRVFLSIVRQCALTKKAMLFFSELEQGKLHDDFHDEIGVPYNTLFGEVVDQDGTIAENHVLPWEAVPNSAKNMIREAGKQAFMTAHDFVSSLRWVQGQRLRWNCLSSKAAEWSIDGATWHPTPVDIQIDIEKVEPWDLDQETLALSARLMREGTLEPLAHELLREAFQLLEIAPRSALQVGTTALEIATKHYIGFLSKESHAVLSEMQSPPIEKLINEVIPKIWEIQGIAAESPPFPLESDS